MTLRCYQHIEPIEHSNSLTGMGFAIRGSHLGGERTRLSARLVAWDLTQLPFSTNNETQGSGSEFEFQGHAILIEERRSPLRLLNIVGGLVSSSALLVLSRWPTLRGHPTANLGALVLAMLLLLPAIISGCLVFGLRIPGLNIDWKKRSIVVPWPFGKKRDKDV
jgi:hypothetical protein